MALLPFAGSWHRPAFAVTIPPAADPVAELIAPVPAKRA